MKLAILFFVVCAFFCFAGMHYSEGVVRVRYAFAMIACFAIAAIGFCFIN